MFESVPGVAGLFVAGAVAGAINSVAGGGTLVSFPSLIAFGVPPVPANATNTAAMVPGALGSVFAYRNDMPRRKGVVVLLIIPSVLGGFLGAWVLAITPNWLFARIVPFLILFATILFAFREHVSRRLDFAGTVEEATTVAGRIWGVFFQFFVALYGGYFGAGIGILMLASLGIMGFTDIHKMNALKTILNFVINGVALVYFILKDLILWPVAILMAAGAILGGYVGARLAKKVEQKYLRVFIMIVGLVVSVWLFYR